MNRIPASASRRHSARTTRPLSASRTNSIAHGIAFGFATYVIIKVAGGQFRQVHPLMYAAATALAAFLVFAG